MVSAKELAADKSNQHSFAKLWNERRVANHIEHIREFVKNNPNDWRAEYFKTNFKLT